MPRRFQSGQPSVLDMAPTRCTAPIFPSRIGESQSPRRKSGSAKPPLPLTSPTCTVSADTVGRIIPDPHSVWVAKKLLHSRLWALLGQWRLDGPPHPASQTAATRFFSRNASTSAVLADIWTANRDPHSVWFTKKLLHSRLRALLGQWRSDGAPHSASQTAETSFFKRCLQKRRPGRYLDR